MSVAFFDNGYAYPDNGMITVDRVYRLAWHQFTDDHWSRLAQIYPRLPGSFRHATQRHAGLRGLLTSPTIVPLWFGDDERKTPHLTCSVEPPGLQITGRLLATDFQQWHAAFIRHIEEEALPASDLL